MSNQEILKERLEQIGNFLAKIDEKIVNIIEKYDSLSEEQKEVRSELKIEIQDIRSKLESFNLDLHNLKIESLKTKNEIELKNAEQTNRIKTNQKYNENISKAGWILIGAAATILFKMFF